MAAETRLDGRVAVVTGATRGGGRAIALALGEQGATVYVTGRSSRATGRTEGMPGTVEDTAEAVSAAGGEGVAVRVDHTVEAEVAALVARVREERGGLDLLVNNAWGGYEAYGPDFAGPFWQQPARRWDAMFGAGVRAAYVTSQLAAPLMLERGGGLIVNTLAWIEGGGYMGSVPYDTAKAAIARMAFGMAHDLRPHGVAVVALAPGFMRTERVLAEHAKEPFDLRGTESPAYLGRAVAALAAAPNVLARSGELLTAGQLARVYGFTDVDGRQPEPFRLPTS
jgi:NAD(P)-dependent dehydrogenase (short-subunit alcohol dehydrogenase family)